MRRQYYKYKKVFKEKDNYPDFVNILFKEILNTIDKNKYDNYIFFNKRLKELIIESVNKFVLI